MKIDALRKRARKAGFRIEKGFQRYMHNDMVCADRETGYIVEDLTTGYWVWGCYSNSFTHLWQIDDVEDFLKSIYTEYDLEW